MNDLTIKNILEVTKGELIIGNDEYICKSYSKDTRTIKEGDCYIGIKGEKFDGNLFWKKALENGASTVIVQNVDFDEENLKKWTDKNIIKVENTLEALYEIASFKRSLYGDDFKLVAVTGSVGKTSTKDIIANVLSQKYKTLKTEGNNNNNIGLPFMILNLDDHEAAVIEMGMNHFGEISLLTKIAKPMLAVITNIGTSHIGNLGSRENILKAKLEILEGMKNPILALNNDNDLLNKWNESNKSVKVITYGIENESEIMAEDIKYNEENTEFTCNLKGRKFNVKVPVAGVHFVMNALSAIAVGSFLGLNNEEIKKGIETASLTKKRMDIIDINSNVKVINDAYNASFESMQASLKNLGRYDGYKKVAVLGDMFELGNYSEKLHKDVGKEVVKNKIDVLICSGENAKFIAEEAISLGMDKEKIYYYEEKEKIIDLLEKFDLNSKMVILFKASNGMKFFDLANKYIEKVPLGTGQIGNFLR